MAVPPQRWEGDFQLSYMLTDGNPSPPTCSVHLTNKALILLVRNTKGSKHSDPYRHGIS